MKVGFMLNIFGSEQAFAELLEEGINIPAWFAFNSKDGVNVVSGDSLAECVAIADSCKKVVSVGINCTPPRFIGGLISTIKKVILISKKLTYVSFVTTFFFSFNFLV